MIPLQLVIITRIRYLIFDSNTGCSWAQGFIEKLYYMPTPCCFPADWWLLFESHHFPNLSCI